MELMYFFAFDTLELKVDVLLWEDPICSIIINLKRFSKSLTLFYQEAERSYWIVYNMKYCALIEKVKN